MLATKNPFEGWRLFVYKPLNIEAMNQAAKRLFEFSRILLVFQIGHKQKPITVK